VAKEKLPKIINATNNIVLEANSKSDKVKGKRLAVLFSGGPAAGGHNVILGIKQALGPHNTLFGIRGGPKGLLNGNLFIIEEQDIINHTNLGGFDLLGSDRTKIKTTEQFQKVRRVVQDFNLDGIIIIGGDDSNTNAAFLAEYLFDDNCMVVGVPKTIDGDLQVGKLLPISFGFDTATKIYSEMVGNILQDTPSSKKYWHFVKLMGRSASHVALEVALQTKPPITLISEEIAHNQMTLNDIVQYIAGIIAYRAGNGINHGIVLIPEGVIEFIPEFKTLIAELNDAMSSQTESLDGLSLQQKMAFIKVSRASASLLGSLPESIQTKLLMDRDAHGNLQVSQIPTEQLLIEMTAKKIIEMQNYPEKFFGPDKIALSPHQLDIFTKFKFATNHHFFGYEGRCGAPTHFDAAYTYNLGLAAGCLILDNRTGYITTITELTAGGKALAIPLPGLLNMERRSGQNELVMKKALVDLNSPAFKYFSKRRLLWAQSDCFSSPGPRQYWGPTANQLPFSIALNQHHDTLIFNLGD
jgi:pyrophosphate--fructose-6-phosphate 1-phosphotransferase